MARRIVVTSGKGGVGKTTVCANLGSRLADFGFRVVIIDTDLGLNNLDVVMGVENKVIYDLIDVIKGRCRVRQALIQDKKFPSLYVLPSTHSYIESNITGQDMKKVVDELSAMFDYVLIDCPAGVESGFHRAVYAANEAILVVTPHISSIRDADKVLSILSSYNLDNVGLIVNRVRGDLIASADMISVEEIMRFLKVPILGVIPDDDMISKLSCIGGHGGESSLRAWTLLAENLHTGTKKIYDCTSKYQGFWGRIRRSIKNRI